MFGKHPYIDENEGLTSSHIFKIKVIKENHAYRKVDQKYQDSMDFTTGTHLVPVLFPYSNYLYAIK